MALENATMGRTLAGWPRREHAFGYQLTFRALSSDCNNAATLRLALESVSAGGKCDSLPAQKWSGLGWAGLPSTVSADLAIMTPAPTLCLDCSKYLLSRITCAHSDRIVP
jgi:hypothetical protein